jgi:site-specific DNA-methyltransferase (adenine-specific)
MTLINGECLSEMDKLIEQGVVVDAIITDPPYGTTACKWDTVIPFEDMWLRLNKLIKPNGAIVLFGSEPFSSALRMSNIKNYKYDWVWDKKSAGNVLVAKFQPLKNHELIHIFNSKTYYPQLSFGHKDRTEELPTSQNKNGTQIVGSGKYFKTTKNKPAGSKYPKSIIEISKQSSECSNSKAIHPTQKPVSLMEYLIKTYTNECEIVLDFTMGSGTTGVACVNTNRNFIGIELDEKYFEIATNRVNEAKSNNLFL